MSRKPIGDKAMTAAERQRRCRATLKERQPREPKKRGRPRIDYLDRKPPGGASEEGWFHLLGYAGHKRETVRRINANEQYESFGRQVLKIDKQFPDRYSKENVERYRPIAKKSILEQLGRVWAFWGEEEEVIEWAEAMLKGIAKGEKLDVKGMVAVMQDHRRDAREWLADPEAWKRKKDGDANE